MRRCKFCDKPLPERMGLSPRQCWPPCAEAKATGKGWGLKQVSDKKMKRLGKKPLSTLGSGKQAQESKAEFELEREWILLVELWWQRHSGNPVWENMASTARWCFWHEHYASLSDMTADHIDERFENPEKKHWPGNLQPICRTCNKAKNELKKINRLERQDRRPGGFRMAIEIFAPADWDFGGRRPRLLSKSKWTVIEILKMEERP